MAGPHIEIESKLRVRDAREARAILSALGVVPSNASDEPVRDVYYDTEDRALLAAGYGFRIRTLPSGAHEATLKSFTLGRLRDAPAARGSRSTSDDGHLVPGADPSITERDEWTAPIPHAKPDLRLLPDGALKTTVASAAQDAPLLPLARVTGRRRRATLAPADGLRVEVAHDRVRLSAGDASVAEQEVEVELLEGSREDYSNWLAGRLRGLSTRASAGSKLERALRAARIRLPSQARVAAARLSIGPAPQAESPATVAAAHALGRLAIALGRAIDGARRGAVEGVHDVRTVSRRLRAVLSAFRDEVPVADRDDLQRRLAVLRRAAGPVRDLDIVREALAKAPRSAAPGGAAGAVGATGLEGADEAGLASLRAALAVRRRKARAGLAEALASSRVQSLGDRVADLAAKLAARGARDRVSLVSLVSFGVAGACRLPRAIERALGRRAAIAGPLKDAEPDALHALRIASKRARYGAELFEDAFGGTVARYAASARALQDALGVVQDARAIASAVRTVVAVVPKGRERDAAARAAATLVERCDRAAKKALGRLDDLADDVLSPRALRELFAHVGKRAAGGVQDAARAARGAR